MKLNSDIIKALREVRGYSYRALAKRAGLSCTLVYYLEHGMRNVTDEVNQRLLLAFGIKDGVTLERLVEFHRMLTEERGEFENGQANGQDF